MINSGQIYGVALNDSEEISNIWTSFHKSPYSKPAESPIVYMKPRASCSDGPASIYTDETVRACSTLALLIASDTTHCTQDNALKHAGAVALAIDFTLPQSSYYRPPTAYASKGGFLALGQWQSCSLPKRIETRIDGEIRHVWSLDRLYRQPARLIADLSTFMTLKAGDVLLVGLPGDAPLAQSGQSIRVTADRLNPVETTITVRTR